MRMSKTLESNQTCIIFGSFKFLLELKNNGYDVVCSWIGTSFVSHSKNNESGRICNYLSSLNEHNTIEPISKKETSQFVEEEDSDFVTRVINIPKVRFDFFQMKLKIWNKL